MPAQNQLFIPSQKDFILLFYFYVLNIFDLEIIQLQWHCS